MIGPFFVSYFGGRCARWPYVVNANWNKNCQIAPPHTCNEYANWNKCRTGVAKKTKVYPISSRSVFIMGGCMYLYVVVYECSSEGK